MKRFTWRKNGWNTLSENESMFVDVEGYMIKIMNWKRNEVRYPYINGRRAWLKGSKRNFERVEFWA